MRIRDIVEYMLESDEHVAIYDTTESDYMRVLCEGYASELDFNSKQRGFVGDEEMVSLIAMDSTIYLGIGNPSGK